MTVEEAAQTDEPPLRQLVKVLWEERQILGDLLFKLEEAHLLLAARRQSWLPRATVEVQDVLEQLNTVDAKRGRIAAKAGAELGLGDSPSLSEIAGAASEPWKTTLLEHRKALLSTVASIQSATTRNRSALVAHLAAVGDALSMLGVERHQSYGDDNRSAAVPTAKARVLDTRA